MSHPVYRRTTNQLHGSDPEQQKAANSSHPHLRLSGKHLLAMETNSALRYHLDYQRNALSSRKHCLRLQNTLFFCIVGTVNREIKSVFGSKTPIRWAISILRPSSGSSEANGPTHNRMRVLCCGDTCNHTSCMIGPIATVDPNTALVAFSSIGVAGPNGVKAYASL